MNLKNTSGSLADETACPKTCSSLAYLASPARTFRHSKNAPVNLHRSTGVLARRNFAYIRIAPFRHNHGRDIGPVGWAFHSYPTSRQSGSDRRNRATETGTFQCAQELVCVSVSLSSPSPIAGFFSRPFRLCGPSGTDCSASNTLFPALFLTVPLNQTKF